MNLSNEEIDEINKLNRLTKHNKLENFIPSYLDEYVLCIRNLITIFQTQKPNRTIENIFSLILQYIRTLSNTKQDEYHYITLLCNIIIKLSIELQCGKQQEEPNITSIEGKQYFNSRQNIKQSICNMAIIIVQFSGNYPLYKITKIAIAICSPDIICE
jgi:hypothetical protein